MSTSPLLPSAPEHWILWDVVEEHLDEAGFCAELFLRAFDDPEYTLERLERGPEGRLLAQLEALRLAGNLATERLLEPLVDSPDAGDPGLLLAGCLGLLGAGRQDLLVGPLCSTDAAVRRIAVQAVALAGTPSLDSWALSQLSGATHPLHQTVLLEVVAARRLTPPVLLGWLQEDDPGLVAAACAAARFADRAQHLSVIEWLLTHSDACVRERATVCGLQWGSANAWMACERHALTADAPSPQLLGLYAALGDPQHHDRLLGSCDQGPTPEGSLRALGYSGNVAVIPTLLDALRGQRPLAAKIAADSFAFITGIDPADDAFSVPPTPQPEGQLPAVEDDPEAQASLPPLDEEPEDLEPAAEDVLPAPNPTAYEAFWREHQGRFSTDRPWLCGRERDATTYAHALDSAPLHRRHVLAHALRIRTAGRIDVDSRAFTRAQRQQAATLARASRDSFVRRFGRW